MNSNEFEASLKKKVKSLSEQVWQNRISDAKVERWLANFETGDADLDAQYRTHALYLLSQFMYFSARLVRELLKALYRDLYRYQIVSSIRQESPEISPEEVGAQLKKELQHTRFVGIGGASESGSHILMPFRQENRLQANLLIRSDEIFTNEGGEHRLRDESVRHYVFLDDFCGSGTQACEYCVEPVKRLRRLAVGISAEVDVAYCTLAGTEEGLRTVMESELFDRVGAVLEMDESFKCFVSQSRYFTQAPPDIDVQLARYMCQLYGEKLKPAHPLGYKNGQLLIGFEHNTPDNTLPIFHYEGENCPEWQWIFRRYPKQT